MLKVYFFPLLFFYWLTACQSGRSLNYTETKEVPLDGFSDISYEKITAELEDVQNNRKSLQFEAEWLNLCTMVVDAEKYACECRLTELKLAKQMAKFGSFDHRMPDHGFIDDAERDRWNAQLEVKKSSRITAEARANLLRRDLSDLTEKIVDAGYQVPLGSVIK